ncbi:hypothetical protein [Thorsellia anophelis]|uniref:Uncharacterized protein n=1 Tax=Thorsellia anophelis DSM 18579 TaxID=1123402 RepID=A0A1I0AQB5_9GAMM|nr:hypothetical protein [Thorsellia anophelis]SES95955.1 hypothetical protein SAMN02583745_00997 [Thorsellia anophelis DSM 18579]
MHTYFKNQKGIIACFAMLFLSQFAYSAPTTLGYYQAGPNEFLPDTRPAWVGQGNEILQNSPFTNPDIFCKLQGDGFRTFSLGEFQGSYRYWNLFGNSTAYNPQHWSKYYNNDITQPRLPNMATLTTRQVGALFNEWGDLNQYGNGWDKPNYWAVDTTTVPQRQALTNTGTGVGGSGNTAYGAVCVSDLIPIKALNNTPT